MWLASTYVKVLITASVGLEMHFMVVMYIAVRINCLCQFACLSFVSLFIALLLFGE